MAFRGGNFRGRRGRSGKPFKRYFDVGDTSNQDDADCSHANLQYRPRYQHTDHRKNRSFGHDYEQEGEFGTPMDKESFTYFSIVHERMDEPFDDEEEKEVFVENVVEQMQGKETNLAMTSIGSRTIQKVLELSTSIGVIEKLIIAFRNDIESLSSNQYSSHALQCVLKSCLKQLSEDDTTSKTVEDFVLGTAEFCVYSFPDILDQPYQNYLLKTVIHVLAGNTLFSFGKDQFRCQPVFIGVPSSFQEMFLKVSNSLLSCENVVEYFQHNMFSIAVQHLIKASSHFPQIAENIIERLLEIMPEADVSNAQIHPFFTNSCSSHLVEATIEHFSKRQLKLFMKKYIFKNLEKIIEHKIANNILKALIRKSPKKETFEKLFAKLEPYFKLIFHLEHDTILVAVADCCIKFDVCQARFVINLKEMLECSEGDKQNYFVLCLLHMLVCEQYIQAESENTATISLNGSLLVQRLLSFSKPIKIAMAIVNTSLDNLKRISCDPKGSHLVDSFMKSKFIGEKSKDKLIAKIKEIAITLACNIYGSRCIDAIWNAANVKQKIALADALAKNIEVLTTNKFGKFVNKNLALYHFKNRFEEWKQIQTSQDKKRKMFNDIVDDNELPFQKKKFKHV